MIRDAKRNEPGVYDVKRNRPFAATFSPIMAGMGRAHERTPVRDLSADYGGYGQSP